MEIILTHTRVHVSLFTTHPLFYSNTGDTHRIYFLHERYIFLMKPFQTPSWTLCPFSNNTLYYSKLLPSRIRSSENDHRALPGGKERAPRGPWMPLLPLAVWRCVKFYFYTVTSGRPRGHPCSNTLPPIPLKSWGKPQTSLQPKSAMHHAAFTLLVPADQKLCLQGPLLLWKLLWRTAQATSGHKTNKTTARDKI